MSHETDQHPEAAGRAEQVLALNVLRAKLGEPARAARELVALAQAGPPSPALQLAALREAARLFTGLRETINADAAWRDLESTYHAASKSRVSGAPRM